MSSLKRIPEASFFIFLSEADKDYLLARHINFLGSSFASRAGFFGQAAVEKYMKALMVQREGSYLAHHSLVGLAKECLPFSEYFALAETLEGLETFEHFEQIGRYGAAAKKDKNRVDTPELQIRGAYVWADTYIHVLDALVAEIRGMIVIEPTYVDALRKIIDGGEGLSLVDLWRGTEQIRDVLLRDNYSFGQV